MSTSTITYTATASGTGSAYNSYGGLVTSSASATATSTLSYQDALTKAQNTANSIAQQTAMQM